MTKKVKKKLNLVAATARQQVGLGNHLQGKVGYCPLFLIKGHQAEECPIVLWHVALLCFQHRENDKESTPYSSSSPLRRGWTYYHGTINSTFCFSTVPTDAQNVDNTGTVYQAWFL